MEQWLETYAPPLLETVFGTPLWALLALPVAIGAAFLIAFSAVPLLANIIVRISRLITGRTPETATIKPFIRALKLIAAVMLFTAIRQALPLDSKIINVLGYAELLVKIYAVTAILYAFVNLGCENISRFFGRKEKQAAVAVVPLLRKIAKTTISIIALLFLIQNLGYDVAAIIAGIGIGGVAIALASQKSIEHLFGGVMLVLDQPVRVGDFCKYGDGKIGTVEDIGLRTTKIRSLERTLIAIPNGDFAHMQLENYAARDKMLILTTIGLRYETTPDQLRYVIKEIRKLLIAHERISEDPARVRFVGFGAFSLDIEIFAYGLTDDWPTLLAIREDIYLRIMDIVMEAGTSFAFPSQTLYMERGEGMPKEQQAKINAEMAALHQQGDVPMPDYPEQDLAKFRDTLGYPPADSRLRKYHA